MCDNLDTVPSLGMEFPMPTMQVDPVAKKAAKKPVPAARKPMVVQVRGSEAWKEWIEELAAKEHDTVAKFLERLADRHARAIGFRDMPTR